MFHTPAHTNMTDDQETEDNYQCCVAYFYISQPLLVTKEKITTACCNADMIVNIFAHIYRYVFPRTRQILKIPMQFPAMQVQPPLCPADTVTIQRPNRRPKCGRMVHMARMRQFMHDDIAHNIRRCKRQPP